MVDNINAQICQNCHMQFKDVYELLHSTHNGRTDMFWHLIRCNHCQKLSLYETGMYGFKNEIAIFTGSFHDEAGETIHGVNEDGERVGLKDHVYVSCAIIEDGDKVLICKRSSHVAEPGKWEFPGGKAKKLEDSWETLEREIQEELEISIDKKLSLLPISHKLNGKILNLFPFVCTVSSGEITLKDHDEFKWVKLYQIGKYDLLEADIKVVEQYIKQRIVK